ncbi:anaerobic C4-dicarboxylate transporter family protein [Cardinium endosymbiont of Oedothorax gibbosus]|uniref:anaerobic C4-dicarboxylate transporter family protein n=1 Tax=Cardinium endosymbiont of Oedothorax gibbosus TaxID=931101 RepID=UPI0020257FB0|nr:anaerobic C4-dicarboxylate transporter family protein [Cardinium endosymbiont of Oedothorax gibbosus]CAH2559958.1 Anaerobic C4-dicarboxylate transporter DcuB [Cardinium endosymbiont of Oedothorax gibbosus]
MVTIGWLVLLLMLVIGLRLGGVSLGLLSGLGLGLLTFSIQPAAPPNDLMLLQATWFLLMATLEATGFFYLLETKLRSCIAQAHNHHGGFVVLFCYGLVFLTGDAKWLHRLVCDQNALYRDKPRLLVPLGIAAHMALLASPLSISGILLIVVAGNGGLAILDLIGMIVAITASITAASSLLVGRIPDKWLMKACEWLKAYPKDDAKAVTESTGKVQFSFLLLLLVAMLFLLIKPEANRLTGLSCKIFPVRFPIFFALVMLSIAAVAILGFKIKPAKILQTYRFKLGIQQFFIFLGLTWLLDSLISHDKTYLIKIVCDGKANYGDYLVAALYMLLIDIPIVIWLFSALLIEQHCNIVTLALWLVVVHSLAPIRCWISSILQSYKNSNSI